MNNRRTVFSSAGYSLIMAFFTGALVLTTLVVSATLLVNQFNSLARYKHTADAHALAKAGINAAVEDLNSGGTGNISDAEVENLGTYSTTFTEKDADNNDILELKSSGTSHGITKKVTTRLTPQTGRFEESFSGVNFNDNSQTDADWKGDGQVYLPDGCEGPLLVNGETRTINQTRSAVSADSNKDQPVLNVSSTAGFYPGQRVLIAQMRHNNRTDFLKLPNAGQEEAIVKNVRANQLVMSTNLKNNYYADSDSKAQIIKINHFTDVTVTNNGVLTAPAWDGATGGILYFIATGTVTIEGGSEINMDGKGYRQNEGPGYARGGAGYGGKGGDTGFGNPGGETYGTAAGVEYMGSGGYQTNFTGAFGGGRIKIITARLDIYGSIQANGLGASSAASGSSGGGIYLSAPTISITGYLSSAGGGGGPNSGSCPKSTTTNGMPGENGKGGKGGDVYNEVIGDKKGGAGGDPNGPPGDGGAGTWFKGGNGEESAGGGGAGISDNGTICSGTFSGKGGGGAGRTVVYYQTYNGGLVTPSYDESKKKIKGSPGQSGYAKPTAAETIGPWAYYINSPKAVEPIGFIGNKRIVSDPILAASRIRKATIYIYPYQNSAGTLDNLSLATGAGAIPSSTASINVSSGQNPHRENFVWDNASTGLSYSFDLNFPGDPGWDPFKTPRIDQIVINYTTSKYNIDYSTWRTE